MGVVGEILGFFNLKIHKNQLTNEIALVFNLFAFGIFF